MKGNLVILLIIVTLILAGCFKIVDTEGLKLAYQDKFLAKGIQLKNLQNVPEDQKLLAENDYRVSEASMNAFFQQVITDAANYRVNVPADNYQKASVHDQVEAFVNKVDGLQPQKQIVDINIPIEAALVIQVISEIFILQGQRQQEAYNRFVNTVTENMMKEYEALPAGAAPK
jgi:hypothetical protein